MGARDEFNSDAKSDRTFYWSANGQPMDFSFWRGHEPNFLDRKENCAHIEKYDDDFKWNDDKCTKKYGSICQESEMLKILEQNSVTKIAKIQKALKESVETLQKENNDKINQILSKDTEDVFDMIKEKNTLILKLTKQISDNNAHMNCTKYYYKKSKEQKPLLIW